ncbi:MAG: hypothetical protein IPN94_16610 [Sphingobacteriales bacterium]|nr:hypothetical protein [Sphingobacteriales bacterium]
MPLPTYTVTVTNAAGYNTGSVTGNCSTLAVAPTANLATIFRAGASSTLS